MRLHDDGDALACDLSQHLQGVHGLLADSGIGRGDLPYQVMSYQMERFILGRQKLLSLLLILKRSGTAYQQLLQRGLCHCNCAIRHL